VQVLQAIGKSVAGNTTKIHMAVDTCGLPIDFEITGGEVHDCKVAPEFFAKLPDADYMIADKSYDSEELREIIREKSSFIIFISEATFIFVAARLTLTHSSSVSISRVIAISFYCQLWNRNLTSLLLLINVALRVNCQQALVFFEKS